MLMTFHIDQLEVNVNASVQLPGKILADRISTGTGPVGEDED